MAVATLALPFTRRSVLTSLMPDGDHAASYMNPDRQWSGGTVGTVTGRDNVAGLFASVVEAFPDAHITINDIFGQGDQVAVRVVVATSSGTASTSTA
jgi:hypothetical protein